MATIPINIGVLDFNGKKVIACDRVYIKPGDDVEWTCAQNFAFAVDFGRATPFEDKEKYQAKKDPVGNSSKVKSKTNKIKEHKTVKYSLAIYDDLAAEVVIEDPEIIIDP